MNMNMDMPLHTPQELVQLSNAAHIAEGIVLILIAALIVAQGFGYLQKGWQRYLVPGVALLASLILAGFLFIDHYNELPRAWHWVMTDMQQQQHFWIGVILGVASIAAIIGIKLKQKWLDLALPVAFAAIGILFLVHPQHGTDAEAARGLLIHRIVGTSLIIAGLTAAGSFFFKQWRKVLAVVTGIALIVSAGGLMMYRESLMPDGMNMGGAVQSHRTYSLNLMEGMAYKADESSELMFDIRDENNKVLKDFDTVHEKQMHLIVVRKDRSYFQHVHPNFDKNSGMFAITDFKFPTDGEYRVFADFTPSSSQMDAMGMKLPVVAYKDVKVGSGKYSAQPLGADRLTSEANGFETGFFLAPDDDSASGGMLGDVFYAGQESTMAIYINKNGEAFRNLQPYLGALGHMVVLGPNLEYVHAHPQTANAADQSGIVIFTLNFPVAGQYKLYLQTQADDQVTTSDFNLTVKPDASGTKNDQPTEDMNMEHIGH